MRGDLVIGIDSSTTATKAIAWDRRGRAVAEGRALRPGQTIGAMFDPSRVLLFGRSGKRLR